MQSKSDISIPSHIRFMWANLAKASKTEDPVAFFLFTHVYSEFWIDQLLLKKCPVPNIIKRSQYTYAIKLTIVYCMMLIPQGMHRNLVILNNIRNKYAHEWKYCFWQDKNIERLTDSDGRLNFRDLRKELLRDKITKKQLMQSVRKVTVGWLLKHCMSVHYLA